MANLVNLIEDGIMKYDGYEGTVIGNLTVVGWNGKYGNPKKYIVICSVCSADVELHGEGYFAMSKGHLVRGCIPCGCTDKCNWTEEQYKVRVKRACEKSGLIFKGWANQFTTANKTLVNADCVDHGRIGNATISFILNPNFIKGCRGCFAIRMGNFKRKDDKVMIENFMSTGAYPAGTVFTRSPRLDKNGYKKYWHIYCPECDSSAEGHIVGIYKGARSCNCSTQRQQEAYINLIKDSDEVIAIKFGVANNSWVRAADQNSRSIYSVEQYGVWVFPDVKSCKAAERTCMHSLPVSLLTKEEMPDGYTETTFPSNIDKVIKIFEEYGGMRNI